MGTTRRVKKSVLRHVRGIDVDVVVVAVVGVVVVTLLGKVHWNPALAD